MFEILNQFSDVALLLVQLVVATIFLSSGWRHLTNLETRAKRIEMPTWATAAVGGVELIAAVALILGVYPKIAALLLVGVMAGALYKKIFAWKVDYFSENGIGWHYELLLLLASLLIAATNSGVFALLYL